MLGIFSNWEKRKKLLEDISKELNSSELDLRKSISEAMAFNSALRTAGAELDAMQKDKLSAFILRMTSLASALGSLRLPITRLIPLVENIKRSHARAKELEGRAKDLNSRINSKPRPKPEEVSSFKQEIDSLRSQLSLITNDLALAGKDYKFNKDSFEDEDKLAHGLIKTVRIEINNFINDAKALKRDNVFLKIADICSKKDLDYLSSQLRKYSWS